ncbi:MAG: autotransporter-associated beta strand repeat-containing protein [Thermoguttaceae bacterium]|jgi:autotransporter-associated beta strand protein
MFRVADAQRDEGAVAVAADEDMEVKADKVERLVPITAAEMARFGLASGVTSLAFRYEGPTGKATVVVDRTKSRATARTFAFFQVTPEVLKAHYVVIYTIDDAKTRRLALLLPASTPESVTISGLDGVSVKDSSPELAGTMRRWNVLLDEARRGEVRLAVDFEMRPQSIGEPSAADEKAATEKQEPAAPKADATGKVTELNDFALPMLTADAVVYQSGLVAIEGDLELGVDVKTIARRADVGQLAIAKYTPVSLDPNPKQPGDRGLKQSPMRLVGTYDFVGQPPKVAVDVYRNPSYALTPAIAERARLTTLLSADGTSQTQATFQLRTKAPYLEVELPEDASLWSAVLDGTPLKPQKRSGIRLIGLPPATTGAARSLQLVYEAPVQNVTNGGRLNLVAPRLLYRASREAKHSREIPLVNIEWTVTVPDGYEAVATDGTLEAKAIARPLPAPLAVVGALYELGGGLSKPSPHSASNKVRQIGMAFGNYTATSADKALEQASGVLVRGVPTEGERAMAETLLSSIAKDQRNAVPFDAPANSPAPAATLAPPARKPGTPDYAVLAETPPAETAATPVPRVLSAQSTPFGYSTPPTITMGSSGIIPSPVRTAPPQPKPEPAKPAEGQIFGNGPPGWDSISMVTKPTYQQQNLLGFRSLKIDVQQTGTDERQMLTFNSLGANPQIGITLARRNRTEALVWGVALAVFVLGVALTRRPVRQKIALVLALGLAAAVLPLVYDTASMANLCNGVFYAASLLVPYYLVAGLVRWIIQWLRGLAGRIVGPAPVATALVLALVMFFSATAQAQPQPAGVQSLAAERAEFLPTVAVPGDAIIVPYDVKSKTGVQDADHLLVSYDRYVELWNRAYPDRKIDAHPAPLPYALSGATYSAVLEGEETLNITGHLQINVLVEGYVSIPLGLRGGVLARADLDAKPAQLKVVGAVPDPAVQTKGGKSPAAMDATLLVLQVSGKGTHKLEMEIRLKLGHQGGWRGTTGSLPTAPAATVTFRVPQSQTEVRLGQAIDRRTHETQRPDETVETALGPGGALQLQWRPKVAEGQVDRGLTVQTASLLDVQEDGLRMALHVKLEFRRSQRDDFTLSLPLDYLVEKVAGSNVRGWEVRRAAKDQTVEVSLLKTAKDTEQFNIFLSRSGKVGQAPLDTFTVPMVTVRDAALSSGQLTIRRSSLLDLRTTERSGVTRTDLGALPDLSGGPATEESVLAIRPYEAYHFPTTPFVLRLSATPMVAEITAEAQTSVKLDPTDPGLESKIIFHVGQRRVYQFEVAVPEDLRLPEVTLPSSGIWSIEKEATRSVLKIHLQQGVLGDAAVILRGKLPALDVQREITLPRLEVLEVKRQEGQIAVQADAAFSVQSRDLRDCQETELDRVAAWLDPQLRAATRLALHYASGAYAGKLRLAPRTPEVVCDTVTNVRVTDRAIEETIILSYSIRNAGIHELTFLLPASMADARISTPMLRRKTVAPVDPKAADSLRRVHLELQGDTMNDLRVLVQNDRLLTPGSPAAPHTAPLPTFENVAGHGADFVRHQYVVLEIKNRDEVVEMPEELQALSRQQQQWHTLTELLGTNQLYKAYLVQPGAARPQLGFYLKSHEEVETAGARIDLAQTTIVVDANGAYRAKVELSLDNSSEQFLDVELPDGATLWTVHVAGEPVKPGEVPGATDARHVLLPVRKTAKGDLNYRVVLKYGGKMPSLSFLSSVQFPLVRNVMPYPSPTGRSIGIEQSQVEIYVPKSHQWFDFGGTVHRTEDEADLKAGQLAAFNKQGQRLIEATHDKDPFARVRATENLKNWVAEAKQSQDEAGRVSNKALQSQFSANSSVTELAKDVLKSAGGKEQEAETAVDNRERLNDLYQKQVNVNGGVLSIGNNSYTGGTIVSAGTLVVQNPADFNGNWITRNNLNNDFTVAQQVAQPNGPVVGGNTLPSQYYQQDGVQYSPPGGSGGLTKAGAGTLTLSGSNTYSGANTFSGALQSANPNLANGRIILGNDQPSVGQGNSSGASLFSNSIGGFGGGNGGNDFQMRALTQNVASPVPQSYVPNNGNYTACAGQMPVLEPSQMANLAPSAQKPRGRRGGVRDEQQRDLAEYQQKLAVANKSDQKAQEEWQQAGLSDEGKVFEQRDRRTPFDSRDVASLSVKAEGNKDTLVINNNTSLVLTDNAGSMLTIAAPTAPAGLASLDFELPTDKNLFELFRFTTPRGDAELTARTVSNSTLIKLELLAGIVLAILLIWAALGLVRRGALHWFRRPLGASLLIVAGLASLFSGVLPFAGLVAMLAGIGLLIAHFCRYCRRRAAV